MRSRFAEGRQCICLLKHFFNSFFENDWITRGQDMGAALAPVFGLVAMPGLLLPVLLFPFYEMLADFPAAQRDPVLWTHMCFYVSFSMLIMGLASVVEWDTLLPSVRDYRILTPLPVRLRTLFAAKCLALLLFMLLFAAAVNTASSCMFPLMVQLHGVNPFRFMAAHATALFSGTTFTSCLLVALQGTAMNALSFRWFRRVSPLLQSLALIGLVCMFFLDTRMSSLFDGRQAAVHPALLFYPPAWFVGLYVELLGQAGPAMHNLAKMALLSLVAATACCVVTYTLSYWRHVRRSLETATSSASGPGPGKKLLGRLADAVLVRHPLERATFHFVAQTLARSRRHRLVMATYAGLGIALAVDSLSLLILRLSQSGASRPTGVLLSIQLVLSFFVMCGLRYAFTIPAELRANWLFQIAENGEGGRHIRGALKALVIFGALPSLAVLFPVHCFLWGWEPATLHFLYGLVLALALAKLLLVRFAKIPFTCSYLPGKANVKLLAAGYFLAFLIYAYSMADLEAWLLPRPWRLMVFCATVLIGLAAWDGWTQRSHGAAGRSLAFRFEEDPDPAVLTLDLLS